MYQLLDGPSKQFAKSVNTTTPVKAQDGASAFPERKVITLQPDNKIYVYFADEGETPSASDIQNRGFTQGKNSIRSYEAGTSQDVFILSQSGTVSVRGAERA